VDPIRFRIPVDDIEGARQPFGGALGEAFLEGVLADAPGWHAGGPADVQILLSRVGGRDVLVEASGRVPVGCECRRCLRPVRSELALDFTLELVMRAPRPAESASGRTSRRAPPDDARADEDLFDGETVDLEPILREQVLLAVPAAEPVCREDCRGLCPACGADRNETDCGHGRREPDPRWAALREIKPAR